MKLLNLFVFLLISTALFANDLYKVSLPKDQKVDGTYSADIDSKATIHIIISKEHNKDTYQLLPIYVAENNSVTQLETVTLNYLPSILSHHFNEGTFSVVGYNEKEKKLSVIGLNIDTGKYTLTQQVDFENLQSTIRLKDKTILTQLDDKYKEIIISEIASEGQIVTKNIQIAEEDQKKFKLFTQASPDPINRNEYVKNGSINNRKLYYEQGKLLYSLDEKKEGTTELMTIDLNGSNTINFKQFAANEIQKQKDYNSYLYKESLFSIASSKHDLVIKAFDLNEGVEKANFSLQKDISALFNYQLFVQDYLKNTSKKKMKPTVSINTSKENKLVIRLDQVDATTYTYHYDWWMMHHWIWHQQMMMHQYQVNQQIMQMQNNVNSMPRFTPNVDLYNLYYNVYSDPEELDSIEFVIDTNFQILKNASTETELSAIDKEKSLEKFKDDKDYKKITAGFTASNFRYIYQDRKSKDIIITLETL